MTDDPASLDRLHDLVIPPPGPWWPPAPGWLILLGIAAIAVLAAMTVAFIHWQSNRYRREAIALLDSPDFKPSEWSSLLKRTALARWPREQVASLTGKKWIAFLDRTGGTNGFSASPAEDLEEISFGKEIHPAPQDLKDAVRRWILNHRKEEP